MRNVTARIAGITRIAAFTACALAGASASGQLELHEVTGRQFGYFGRVIANVGDVNGDGIDDLVVGQPGYDFKTANMSGRVHVVNGRTGTRIRIDDPLPATSEYFGRAVAAVGDVDGDQVPDYVVGAPYSDAGRGSVSVLSGASGALIWSVTGSAADEGFGWIVGGAGDLDGDGLAEVLVSRTAVNQVDVYTSSGVLLDNLSGQSDSAFGQSLTGLGDLDGDGSAEFAVGEPWYRDASGDTPGRVRIYSGATRTVLSASLGDRDGDRYGSSLARGDDYDGDGHDDLIVGAPEARVPGVAEEAGRVHVYSAKRDRRLWRSDGTAFRQYLGAAVARTGDVNGDGVPDYLASTYTSWYQIGFIRVFSGIDGALLLQVDGEQGGYNGFGETIAGGNWNGDALGDWAVGQSGYFDPVNNEDGVVYFFAGCPSLAVNYGAGWPGTNGVPSLDCIREPVFDERCEIRVGNSKSGLTFGLLYLGFAEANIPTSADGTLLVLPTLTIPFYVYGASTNLWGDIPDDPSLAFLDFYLQAIEADPGASEGLSFTAGLKLTIGFDLP